LISPEYGGLSAPSVTRDKRSDRALHNHKVLVIDDDPDLVELLRRIFVRAGAQVLGACDGREGLRQFYRHQPDLVVLDVMMPGMDGWEVCRALRQLSDVPILMLSAKSARKDIMYGLDRGADDYVTKPFDIQILLARARALLRRTAQPAGNDRPAPYDDGYLAIDPQQRRVWVRQEPINLTPTEYEFVAYLFENAGHVLTHEQILKHVWGGTHPERAHYVHVYVHRLRKKLEKDPARPQYLVKEHGVGYRFEPQGKVLPSLRTLQA
jgi:two-component system KDP operon response regulator KdpE